MSSTISTTSSAVRESGDPRVVYRCALDPEDRIVSVNGAWRRFAEDNRDPGLPDRALGTSLWDHVSGAEVRTVYRDLFLRAREEKRPIEVPFRCDAPHLRRYLRLRIEPRQDGGLDLVSWAEREEGRDPLPFPAREGQAPLSGDPLGMCAWCKKVRVDPGHPDGEWVELEEAVERLDLFGIAVLPRITHGICPDCSRGMQEI